MKTGLMPVGLSFCQNMRYNTQRKLFWLKEETRKFSSLRPLLPSASFLSGACLCLLKSNQPWKDQILEGGHCRIKASLFCFRLPNFLMIKEPNFFPSLSLFLSSTSLPRLSRHRKLVPRKSRQNALSSFHRRWRNVVFRSFKKSSDGTIGLPPDPIRW